MAESVAILVSLVIYWFIGFFSAKPANATREEFAVGERTLSAFLIAAGLSMTFVGGAATVSMSSLGYQFGLQALIDPVSVLIGLTIAAILVKQYRSDNFVSITESLSGVHGGLLRLTSLISVIFYVLLMAANVAAFTKLVEGYFSVPGYVISAVGTILVASYTLRSGIIAVTKTDVVMLVAILLCFIFPCLYLVSTAGTPAGPSKPLDVIPTNTVIILSFTLLLCPVLQDVKLRAQAARSESAARIGILAAALLYVAIVGTAVIVGRSLALSGFEVVDSERVLAIAFSHTFGSWGVLFIIGVLAAILSTLDGFALSAITTAQAFPWAPLRKNRSPVWVGTALFLLALFVAVVFPHVLSLVLLALLLYVSLLLPLGIGRYIGVEDNYLILCSGIFVIAGATTYFAGWEPLPYAVMFPVGHLALVIAAYLLSRSARPAESET